MISLGAAKKIFSLIFPLCPLESFANTYKILVLDRISKSNNLGLLQDIYQHCRILY